MAEKQFDASRYLTNLEGREYLEVKWRLLWLRTEHPDAIINTEMVEHDKGLAVFKARVMLPGGGEATGWGSESVGDFEEYIEAAETKALGRALAALGYGTQFCQDFEYRKEGEPFGEAQDKPLIVDAPVTRAGTRTVRESSRGERSQGNPATEAQVNALYTIARTQLTMDEGALNQRCLEVYGVIPKELTRRQASQFIDALKGLS
ncbi:MAG: hypothetical protein HW403_864 [Dehalococcoidia bacterium]|nr:hypothetical protein [Dehalococcoidia bacterium]